MEIDFDYVLVDAPNLMIRSWWPVKEFKSSEGVYNGLEYGLIKNVLNLRRRFMCEVFLFWDGEPVRAKTLYPQYKEGRKKLELEEGEGEWKPRIKALRESLSHLTPTLYDSEKEADELIASIVNGLPEGKKVLIYSTDDDLKQHVSRDCYAIDTKSNVIGPKEVYEKFGVSPERLVQFRCISGDTSDKITGIPRIRAKTKIRLLNQAPTSTIEDLWEAIRIDGFLTESESKKLRTASSKEVLERNYTLMDLSTQPHLDIPYCSYDADPALRHCRSIGLENLSQRNEWRLFRRKGEPLKKEAVLPKPEERVFKPLTVSENYFE